MKYEAKLNIVKRLGLGLGKGKWETEYPSPRRRHYNLKGLVMH